MKIYMAAYMQVAEMDDNKANNANAPMTIHEKAPIAVQADHYIPRMLGYIFSFNRIGFDNSKDKESTLVQMYSASAGLKDKGTPMFSFDQPPFNNGINDTSLHKPTSQGVSPSANAYFQINPVSTSEGPCNYLLTLQVLLMRQVPPVSISTQVQRLQTSKQCLAAQKHIIATRLLLMCMVW
jgi:hypothetical protein